MVHFFSRAFTVALLLLCSVFIYAQNSERCATMQADSILRAKNPGTQTLQDFENWLQQKMNNPVAQQRSRQVYTIPVVVHVIHNGDAVGSGENLSQAQINSQIAVLNEDFRRLNADRVNTISQFQSIAADVEIEFCLAQVDPNGVPLVEPGIHRVNGGRATWGNTNDIDGTLKPQTFWDPNRYFNIWTVDFGNTGLLGYAQFPEASGLAGMPGGAQAANTDGIVCLSRAFGRVGNVQSPSNRGRTATHEVGHWLGLRHIWGDGGCGVDDFCGDTPDADAANQGCNTSSQSCGNLEMVQNYMDYTNDACMNIFTLCQKTRMVTALTNSPRRVQLLNSTVCTIVNPIPVTGRVRDAQTLQGIPNAKVRFVSGNFNFTATCDAQGNFSISNVAEAIYTVYGGQWGYVTGRLQNVNVQQGVQPIIIDVNRGFYDDFALEFNWVKATTATSGAWVREVPVGTLFNNVQCAPGADVTNDFEREAYVTGNGGGTAGTDDVDDGTVTLTSPVFNLATANDPRVRYNAWFFNGGGSGTPNDTLKVRISNGQQTVTLENITANSAWGLKNFRIRDFLTPTANMTVQFITGDIAATGHLVEAGLDLFRVTDTTAVVNIPPVANFSANNASGCGPLTVNFTDLSTNNPTSWAWNFIGGTPSTSTVKNPSVTYNTPGTYAVTLTATNQFGSDPETKTGFITVTAPVADFTSDATSGCPGLRVSFNDITTCNPSSRIWQFPGGSPATSTLANPQVIYNALGQYSVTLISGGDTITKTNFINVTNGGAVVALTENFESGFATNGWTIENPDNAITWQIATSAGNTSGTQSAAINLFSYQTVGQRDRLVSKSLDLTNVDNTTLTFKHAHRRYIQQQGQTPQNRDSLIVYVSTNNGSSWTRILSAGESGQGSFATNSSTTVSFTPAIADDWCFSGTIGAQCFNLNLSAYDGLPNVRIRFESVNDYGNNIWLDDIVVSGICANVPNGPVANFSANNTSACGSLSVNFTDASVNNPTSWQWTFAGGNPASSTQQNPTVTYTTPGVYPVKLKVTNTNGSDSLTLQSYVTVYDFPNVTLNVDNISCNGFNDGSVEAVLNNSVNLPSYLWSNAATTSVINNLPPSSYSLTVTSEGNCTATASATLSEPTSISLSFTQIDAVCNQNNGSIDVSVSGGVSPYTFDWSNGANTEDLSNLVSGNYEVIVLDSNGCAFTQAIDILNEGTPIISANVVDVDCNGANNGEIEINITGGVAPYSYNWNNGANTSSLSGLAAGSYLFTVTDQAGCFETGSVIVNEPDSLLLNIAVTNIACEIKFGTLTANVAGGTFPYDYNWSNNVTVNFNNFLEVGNYTLTVADANGCVIIGSESIIELPDSLGLDLMATPDNGTANGTATANPTTGNAPFSYTWSNGGTSATITNLPSGTYYVTVVDAGTCSAIDSVFVPFFNSVVDEVISEVAIYPNPSNGYIHIAALDAFDIQDVLITDALGKQIQFDIEKVNAKEYDLDFISQANGVYFISVKYNNNLISKRIVLVK